MAIKSESVNRLDQSRWPLRYLWAVVPSVEAIALNGLPVTRSICRANSSLFLNVFDLIGSLYSCASPVSIHPNSNAGSHRSASQAGLHAYWSGPHGFSQCHASLRRELCHGVSALASRPSYLSSFRKE